jgi:serine/threonine protein kinase
MGEVYRGRDTRLGRDVALKVISPDRVENLSLRRRFELEARAASVLNHPSIVTIYDVGETEGISWIAMEWVEGRTLREALMET